MSDSESITARTGVHKAMANFASPCFEHYESAHRIMASEDGCVRAQPNENFEDFTIFERPNHTALCAV